MLIITGSGPIHQESFKGVLADREDLKTRHEEAYVIIDQQVVAAAKNGYTCIKVV